MEVNRLKPQYIKAVFGIILLVFISVIIPDLKKVSATDGESIMDVGIFSWIKYQQKQFFTDIIEVRIKGKKVHDGNQTVCIYQPIIFENQDQENHRFWPNSPLTGHRTVLTQNQSPSISLT